ncbi:uncharacterized protein LOC100272181 precursor [Bombyx mori]|uniref:Bm122 n=1 Tax=Bombyx mori TaxID=7091 RepID=C0LZJ2_BOMMO|nr:uncharacterized protein LOC100272181 precursor [Bombyx mori]ACN81326.1 Bm122 [Bombyx mori]
MQMKFTLLFVLVIVTAVAADEEAGVRSNGRPDLVIGTITSQDSLIRSFRFNRPASPSSQSHFHRIAMAAGVRISAITAREVGQTQNPTIRVAGGGIGFNNVNLEARNARGRGFSYNVQIWGR